MALGALETSRLAKIPRRRALKPRRVVRWPAGCWTTPMDAGLTSPTCSTSELYRRVLLRHSPRTI